MYVFIRCDTKYVMSSIVSYREMWIIYLHDLILKLTSTTFFVILIIYEQNRKQSYAKINYI